LTLQQQQCQAISKITVEEEIGNGLDFILSHFEQPVIFPRTVMATELLSKVQKKYQRFNLAYSREEALKHFKKYDFVDCRINAFPLLKEGATWQPELLFIDLDLADFNSSKNPTKSLDLALNKTLKNIKEKLNGFSTVLGSGNGYHIIQPIECPILEEIEQFQKYGNKSSEQFLRFSKNFLSNGKADRGHNPSFRSCLLRIPGSINSKCLNDRDKRLSGDLRVKSLHRWNRIRPLITREFIEDFRTYLEQKITDQENNNNNYNYKKKEKHYNNQNRYSNSNHIEWIEKVLQIPIEDGRKKTIELILVPYLILIKKLSNEETYQVINEWLQKCDLIRKLDFDKKTRINFAIKDTERKQISPMRITTLKTNYKDLYLLFVQKEK
jgi:hypothetical protein